MQPEQPSTSPPQPQPKTLLFSRRFMTWVKHHTPTFQIPVFEITGTMAFAYGNLLAISPTNFPNDILRGMQGSLFIPICLFVCFGWAMFLTGAHFNPAVTLAFMMRKGVKRVPWRLGLLYMLSEITGAMLGALYAWSVATIIAPPMIGEMPIKQVCLAFLAEIYGTFILVFFVMYSSCPDSTFLSSNIEKYVFVPLVVLMAREYSYRSQGLNPAFAIAFQFWWAVFKNQWYLFKYVWATFFGPFVGAILAVLFFDYFYRPFLMVRRIRERENMEERMRMKMGMDENRDIDTPLIQDSEKVSSVRRETQLSISTRK